MRVKLSSGIASVQIAADGDGLTSRAGTALLVGLADRVGLTGALSDALWDVRERRGVHDPGRVLCDLGVMLADGGDCLTDLGVLRDQQVLFGVVASDATAWRLIHALGEERLDAI
ncbi:MAG TPA: transposase, partial [Gaiellales bacterium]|nr:transposase [Gaiellales bacterium]